MDGFQRELLSRLPLALSVWTVLRHVVTDELAAKLFEAHRGTGREGQIPFATLIALVAAAASSAPRASPRSNHSYLFTKTAT